MLCYWIAEDPTATKQALADEIAGCFPGSNVTTSESGVFVWIGRVHFWISAMSLPGGRNLSVVVDRL